MPRHVAVIGAGPAGLIAAERLAAAGCAVTVLDRMPSAGRKLLMAGRGGLNLTHGAPLPGFLDRYGAARDWLAPAVEAFPPAALRQWCEELGQPTFVGSSGRVFPTAFKAAPLLRAWLRRLAGLGVVLRPRHRWLGWDASGALCFTVPEDEAPPVPAEAVPHAEDHAAPRAEGQAVLHPGSLAALRPGSPTVLRPEPPALLRPNPHAVLRPESLTVLRPDATLLALGGASWPRLGSDGAWTAILRDAGIAVAPLRPANAGVTLPWSAAFRDRFAGTPLKRIGLRFGAAGVRGEAMVTAAGLEGGAVYALSGPLRDAIAATGEAIATLDLRPDLDPAELLRRLRQPRRGQSLANVLRRAAGLPPVAIGLLRELAPGRLDDPAALAGLIRALPLRLTGVAGIERAISSAGGVSRAAVDGDLMLCARPGVFVAGEMLDWEAPTGGWLLQGAFSTGWAAAGGVLRWLGVGEKAFPP